jgi:hypothetical protein
MLKHNEEQKLKEPTFPIANSALSKNKTIPSPMKVTPKSVRPTPISERKDPDTYLNKVCVQNLRLEFDNSKFIAYSDAENRISRGLFEPEPNFQISSPRT